MNNCNTNLCSCVHIATLQHYHSRQSSTAARLQGRETVKKV